MENVDRRTFLVRSASGALALTAGASLLIRPSSAQAAEPEVDTTAGTIQGLREDGLNVFKGVPYAAPPVGDRRWLPPGPPQTIEGVYKATSFRPIAPQQQIDPALMPPAFAEIFEGISSNPEPTSEDCLHLNIWSPGLDDAKRPVLFWIHGGAFNTGSGSMPSYSGTNLANRGDVVVVTINYRLGPLGFINLNDLTQGAIPSTGNEGLLDQVAALEWVRDNIAAFGGDPGNVTIFGESAGGMSVGALLGMPRARGLFHKAIPQSGACHTALPRETARRIAELFLKIADVAPNDAQALRSLSVEELLAAQTKLGIQAGFMGQNLSSMPLQPVIDGEILPALPFETVQNGSADGVPILVGTTAEEWNLFKFMDPTIAGIDEAGIKKRLGNAIREEDAERLIATYRESLGPDTSMPDIYGAITTDQVFRVPAVRLAEAHHRRGQQAYSYLFTWKSPAFGGALGACHALEIGFAFGNLTPGFHGSGPEAEALTEAMQDAWIAFARTGDPSGGALGTWPTYGKDRATMILDKDCRVQNAPNQKELAAWEGLKAGTL